MPPNSPTPFVFEQRVSWGQCDPAKIAYTGWIPMWALEAINAWWETHVDAGWYGLELDKNVGTPFVHLDMDFRAPITPRHRLFCFVQPIRLGTKSVTFEVIGRQDGMVCFDGHFTSVFMVANTFKSCAAPDDIRAVIEPLLMPAARQGVSAG